MTTINTSNKINQVYSNLKNNSDLTKNNDTTSSNVDISSNVIEDTFSYTSTESYGGYTKESLTSNQGTIEDALAGDTEEETKGMDISKLTGTSYTKANGKIDVDQLKSDQLVNFQNMIQQMINGLADEDGKIPTRVQQAAQASLEGDGFWSPESVSTRILDMAKALSGGDPETFEILKEAVLKGFGAAADEWGDDLPEITNVTLDLVMKGFDDWYKELNPTVAE